MTRITNTIAEGIAKAVTDHAFSERIATAKEALEAAALAAYRYHYGEESINRMNALPDGWLPCISRLDFAINGQRLFARIGKPVQITYLENEGWVKINGDVPEAVALQRAAHALDRLEKERSDAESEALRAVKRFSTIKALVAGWPEIAPFAAKFDANKPSLPVVIPAELNAKLGLPVEDAAT